MGVEVGSNDMLKKAKFDMETQTKKAQSELSYELQAAKTQQRIKEETMQIKVGRILGHCFYLGQTIPSIHVPVITIPNRSFICLITN